MTRAQEELLEALEFGRGKLHVRKSSKKSERNGCHLDRFENQMVRRSSDTFFPLLRCLGVSEP